MSEWLTIIPTIDHPLVWIELRAAVLRRSGDDAVQLRGQELRMTRYHKRELPLQDDEKLELDGLFVFGEEGPSLMPLDQSGRSWEETRFSLQRFMEFIPEEEQWTAGALDELNEKWRRVGYNFHVSIGFPDKLTVDRLRAVACAVADLVDGKVALHPDDCARGFNSIYSSDEFARLKLHHRVPFQK